MPRGDRVYRRLDGLIVVVLNHVEHAMSDPAFIAFMEQAIDVLQRIAAEQHKPKGDA